MLISYHKFTNPDYIKYNIEKHAKWKMLYVQYASIYYKTLPVSIWHTDGVTYGRHPNKVYLQQHIKLFFRLAC